MNHLSVSNANDFIERPAKWWLARVRGYKFTVGMPAFEGFAIEEGLIHFARNGDIQAAIESAQDVLSEKAEGFPVDEVNPSQKVVADCVAVGAPAFRQFCEEHGGIKTVQEKVTTKLLPDGLDWIGYKDVTLNDGTIVDIKRTGRTPSTLSGGHARQLAFYSYCDFDAPACCFYVVPLKSSVKVQTLWLEDSEATRRLSELRAAEQAIHKVLSADPEVIKAAFFPDPDHYTYADVLPYAKSEWGIAA